MLRINLVVLFGIFVGTNLVGASNVEICDQLMEKFQACTKKYFIFIQNPGLTINSSELTMITLQPGWRVMMGGLTGWHASPVTT